MAPGTLVRIVAIIGAVIVLGIIIMRRRARKSA